MSRQNDDDAVAGAAMAGAAILLALMIALAAAVTTFVILMLVEVGKIYASRAWGQGTKVAQLLWLALIAELGTLLVGFLLMTDGATWPYGATLNAWSFLLFVIVIECCDRYQARVDLAAAEVTALGGLDHHLGPLQPPLNWSPPVNGRSSAVSSSHG